jgi:hypothetical protein
MARTFARELEKLEKTGSEIGIPGFIKNTMAKKVYSNIAGWWVKCF